MKNPVCPECGQVFSWSGVMKQILSLKRTGTALWGAVCPTCRADLKVPNSRVLLIVALAVFFGSQSSTILLLGQLSRLEFLLAKVMLIIGFYAIAVFFFLKLERVE